MGIYILAVWPGNILTAERVLPVAISTALILAVWLLGRSLLDRAAANAAAVALALMPSSWALLGGDVPRGLWLLFLVLALREIADSPAAGLAAQPSQLGPLPP